MTYEELARLVKSKPSGPRPFFLPAHLIRYLDLVESRRFGRQELAQRLRIGEGSVRTITHLLRSQGMIRVGRGGTSLTEKGKQALASLRKQFTRGIAVPGGVATIDACNVAILVRGAAERISLGIEQRDAAMAVGSRGASTFIFSSGKFVFPGMFPDLSKVDAKLSEKLMEYLHPQEGDVIVIGSDPNLDTAHLGAIAAGASLL